MRREELFMDILGGLDEKYVSMAMPRSCDHSTVGDTGNVIEIKPVEVSPEVSKKDMRIYWITRTLGMAAAAVLIVGAAVLLIMNWDKIAVSEPDRPGVVTTVGTSSAVTATSLTEPTKSDNNTADSDKINELRKRIGEKKREIENAESAKNAYVQKADDAGGRLTALTEKLEELRALDETSETIQEISAAEAEIEYYSELKAAYDKEISNYEEHIDSLKRELSDLEHEELLEVEKMRDIQHSETTTYVNENKERPVTTSSENHEITTSETTVVPTDETADTTAPAEEQPSDDELKALVEQGAEDCGLKITVNKLTRASLNMHYVRDRSVRYAEMLAYGISDRYEIQVQKGGTWQTYDPVNLQRWNDEEMWFDSLLGIGGEEYGDEEDDLILFYGSNMYESEIPNGHYRIAKTVGVKSEITGAFLGQLTAYAEFTIDERTPNIFGITMTANDTSLESVKLVVQQSGANFHVKRNLGYEYPYYIQRKTSTGEWEKLDSNPVTWDPDIMPLNENGTTEITVKFAHEYGTLPNGTYRISQRFVNYVYSGNGELSVINRSTYFCEFEITDGEKNWGITLSINEGVTAEGLTLVISQRGGSYTGELEYGEPYSIERKNGEKWEPLEYFDGAVWHDLAYFVEPNTDKEIKLDWKWLYGTLPAGTYRIAKEFMDFRGSGDYDKQTFYVPFKITDDMASKLGIALRALKYNARTMTLQIVQTGDTGYEKIGTDPYRYTIERKTDGIWQSYYAPQAGVPTPDLGLKVKNSGVTEYKLDWSEAAGSLPVGDYRLGMTFSCGDITETRYCEFTVEAGMTNEFGIAIRALEISRTGGKFAIESVSGSIDGLATYTNAFRIQKQTGSGKWKDIEKLHTDGSTDIRVFHIGLHTGAGYIGQTEEVSWAYFYGKLTDGHYRMVKTFREDVDGDARQIDVCGEFDINADTPETMSD